MMCPTAHSQYVAELGTGPPSSAPRSFSWLLTHTTGLIVLALPTTPSFSPVHQYSPGILTHPMKVKSVHKNFKLFPLINQSINPKPLLEPNYV